MIEFDSVIEYARADFTCTCGKRHRTDISEIRIDENAIRELPSTLQNLEPRSFLPDRDQLLLVADENTWAACGEETAGILQKAGYKYGTCIFPVSSDLVPDENAVFTVLTEMESETSCFISIGSGTLNDLTRFVSFKTGRPYICVGTAPSMDGYASNLSPMIYNNLKITYTTQNAAAIIASPAVLAAAPGYMLAAGLGDILGKYTALADWSLSVLAADEYHCPEIAALVRETADESLRRAPELAQRDSAAVQQIMEALLITGFAMSYAGNSRPASGAEHHIAHYWEMLLLQREGHLVLHGTKVGLATIAVCELYHRLAEMKVDFAAAAAKAAAYDFAVWEEGVRRTHGAMTDELIRQIIKEDAKNSVRMVDRIKSLENRWDQVLQLSRMVPRPEEIRQALAAAGGAVHPDEIGISREDVAMAVRYASDLRNRFSILQMCNELGITDQAVQIVDDLFYAGS